MRWRAAVATAWLCGCAAPGLDRNQLPERPIAIVHRTLDEGERRAELLRSREAGQQGTVRLEDVGQLLGLGADDRDPRAALLGHLALVHAPSGRVERVPAALPGERPLCWSHDYDRLLLVSFQRAPRPQLYEYSRSLQEIRAVTHGPAAHPFGCYGPGGRLVVARVRAEGARLVSRIVVLSPPDAPRVLTPGPADSKPAWSPRGDLIAYETLAAGGSPSIATIEVGGGTPRLLTSGRDPSFTPDGAWIVFSARSRGRWALWRMRPDGSGRVRLGASALEEHDPAVSPDGRYVLFVGGEPETLDQQIFVRRFDGEGQRPLLDRDEGMSPTW